MSRFAPVIIFLPAIAAGVMRTDITQGWLPHVLQVHLHLFSTFEARGGIVCMFFMCPFILPLAQFCIQVMVAHKVLSLQLSAPAKIKVWDKQKTQGQNPLIHAQLSKIQIYVSDLCAFLAEWNKQCQRFASVYVHSLSKKNFDSPLVFAMQTFQQLNFSDMMFWGKEFQICLHRRQQNLKFEHVFFHIRKLKNLVNCRGQTISMVLIS